MSIFLPLLIFGCLALFAAAFVCWPILARTGQSLRARSLLAAAVAAVVLGIGGGTYLILGQPYLAARTFAAPSPNDLRGLIALLAQRVRQRPGDPQGWTLLGRGYLTLGDTNDAAAAFRRAIPVAAPQERPALYAAYGEALTMSAGGAVTDDAEAAFTAALRDEPKNFAARYYLGLAYAQRRENAQALSVWQSLLADAPASAPWRAELLDRIALLTGRGGGAAPDIGAMVAQLAARLKAQPEDAEGWQRLIRAYAVLGDGAKARAALSRARAVLAADGQAQSRLTSEARELKLEK